MTEGLLVDGDIATYATRTPVSLQLPFRQDPETAARIADMQASVNDLLADVLAGFGKGVLGGVTPIVYASRNDAQAATYRGELPFGAGAGLPTYLAQQTAFSASKEPVEAGNDGHPAVSAAAQRLAERFRGRSAGIYFHAATANDPDMKTTVRARRLQTGLTKNKTAQRIRENLNQSRDSGQSL